MVALLWVLGSLFGFAAHLGIGIAVYTKMETTLGGYPENRTDDPRLFFVTIGICLFYPLVLTGWASYRLMCFLFDNGHLFPQYAWQFITYTIFLGWFFHEKSDC